MLVKVGKDHPDGQNVYLRERLPASICFKINHDRFLKVTRPRIAARRGPVLTRKALRNFWSAVTSDLLQFCTCQDFFQFLVSDVNGACD